MEDLTTLQPAEIPDDTEVYIHGYGVTTVGELRTPLVEVAGDKEDASMRLWLWTILYAPRGAKPWKDGYITHGGKRYPLSIFNDDGFIRLSQPRMPRDLFDDVDMDDPVAIKAAIGQWREKNPAR